MAKHPPLPDQSGLINPDDDDLDTDFNIFQGETWQGEGDEDEDDEDEDDDESPEKFARTS